MSNDLLERRAARGEPRGAANIWADAQATTTEAEPQRPWLFRLVILSLVIVAGFVFATLTSSDSDESRTASENPDAEAPASSEPLPLSYLIEGQPLETVIQPPDPAFDADGLFGEANPISLRPLDPPQEQFDDEVFIFAENAAAFEGPIFGLVIEPDGTRSTWSVNIDDSEQLTALTSSLTEVDGLWELPADSGLVGVAQYEELSLPQLTQQWDFFFPGSSLFARPASEWGLWPAIAGRATGMIDVDTQEVRLESIGQDAIRIRFSEVADDFGEEVIWQVDDYVYQLSGDVDLGVQDIAVVDRDTWIDAVENARRLNDLDEAPSAGRLPLWFEWLVLYPVGAIIGIKLRLTDRIRWEGRLAIGVVLALVVAIVYFPFSLFIPGLISGPLSDLLMRRFAKFSGTDRSSKDKAT